MLNRKFNPSRNNPVLVQAATEFVDTTTQLLSEKIGSDYAFILKSIVLPALTDSKTLKLREIRILASLAFYDRPLSHHFISDMLRFDPATVSRGAKALENKGLLKRKENMVDQRSVLMELTSSGRKIADEYTTIVRDIFTQLENAIDEQISETEKMNYLDTLVKINKRSSQMRAICEAELKRAPGTK